MSGLSVSLSIRNATTNEALSLVSTAMKQGRAVWVRRSDDDPAEVGFLPRYDVDVDDLTVVNGRDVLAAFVEFVAVTP